MPSRNRCAKLSVTSAHQTGSVPGPDTTHKLQAEAREVEVKMPELRRQAVETAIIECYRRGDISIEETIVQVYLAGVSICQLEDITEALCRTRVSSGRVSNLNKKVYTCIQRRRTAAIEGEYLYV